MVHPSVRSLRADGRGCRPWSTGYPTRAVALRDTRPDFDTISGRLAARGLSDWAARTSPATFVAFDLLELDGRMLVDEP
jgi:hypothetical protein